MAGQFLRFDRELVLNPDIITATAKVDAFHEMLVYVPMTPEQRRTYDELRISREVDGTTAIEGNAIGEDNLTKNGEGVSLEPMKNDAVYKREHDNAREAQLFVLHTASVHPERKSPEITEDFIKEIHNIITKELDYEGNIPGRYRLIDVKVGKRRECPGFEEVPNLMKRFMEWINGEAAKGLHPLHRAILAHFYLVAIHPFADGNGRTARTVEAYLISSAFGRSGSFFALSKFYYDHRPEYFDKLEKARKKYAYGGLEDFLLFALSGLEEERRMEGQDALINLWGSVFNLIVDQQCEAGHISKRCRALVNLLQRMPIPRSQIIEREDPIVAALYEGVSTARTIERDLKKLFKLRLIVQTPDKIVAANYHIVAQFTGLDPRKIVIKY